MCEQSVEQPDLSNFEMSFTEGQCECGEDKYGQAAESFAKALEAGPTDEQRKEALYHRAYAWFAQK